MFIESPVEFLKRLDCLEEVHSDYPHKPVLEQPPEPLFSIYSFDVLYTFLIGLRRLAAQLAKPFLFTGAVSSLLLFIDGSWPYIVPASFSIILWVLSTLPHDLITLHELSLCEYRVSI